MQKPKNVVPISAGLAVSDPEHFTISVGSIPFRFRMGPNGRSAMIGPANLIDFPGAHGRKELAKRRSFLTLLAEFRGAGHGNVAIALRWLGAMGQLLKIKKAAFRLPCVRLIGFYLPLKSRFAGPALFF